MEKIPSIAFEGINRAGKGTQIELLKKELFEMNVSSIELRGDGTRDGSGSHDGDPLSPWWQQYSKKLREGGSTEEWHQAAYQLALDFISWKKSAEELEKDIIFLDRSLLSRATFVIDRDRPAPEILEIEHLYPIQRTGKIKMEDVLPDVIFELTVPKEVLLSRLDPADPKLKFRENLIESNYDNFYNAKNRLPEMVQERIVSIDSSQPIDKVFDEILEDLNSKLDLFKKDKQP